MSELLIDRMVLGGVSRLCFVIGPGKSDILEYFGSGVGGVPAAYVVQPEPRGLCDAVFRALPLIAPEEHVLVGLPDSVWFPEHGMSLLGDGGLSFLCFPVDAPERFDAVVARDDGEVVEIRVQDPDPGTRWVWGAFKLDGATLRALHELWCERGQADQHIGTLVTAWIARGGSARAVRAGEVYVDVGTMGGYREAARLLGERG